MDPTLLPTGATVMLEIIGLMAIVAGGFSVWLWRQHRRIQQMGDRTVR